MDKWKFLLITFGVVIANARADTPANCTYEDIQGTWIFSVTKIAGDNTINCTKEVDYEREIKITLDFPDFAVDEFGNTGFWTVIYNQGFEVVIGGKKFFAFSYYSGSGKTVQSICHRTWPGWVHTTDERNWDCFIGQKADGPTNSVNGIGFEKVFREDTSLDRQPFGSTKDLVKAINSNTTLWKAVEYPEFTSRTMAEMLRMAGGRRSARAFPKFPPVSNKQFEDSKLLPSSFDWRNKDGVNFVSPIRNQESCGSCYAFGSMALYEARERIYTNNSVQKVYSTQDIVSCSEYSQGCEGGFPYLIAGKYGQDFGLIEDSCFPYKAHDMPCQPSSCPRTFTRDYYYVGGYYGACNEALMRAELVKNGPIAVSFEVYKDFVNYKGGVYHHVESMDNKFNPWEITNHVVLVVGYGVQDGTPYWIVKNSWGTSWGEDGYFRIMRGNDECSIESMAVGIHPVV